MNKKFCSLIDSKQIWPLIANTKKIRKREAEKKMFAKNIKACIDEWIAADLYVKTSKVKNIVFWEMSPY